VRVRLVVAGIGAALLAGCGASYGAPVALVTPRDTLATEPVDVVVSGLAAHAPVTLMLRSQDRDGVVWSSSARFLADAHGRVALGSDPAVSGSYRGVWRMGLVASMLPDSGSADYQWELARPFRFTLTARQRARTVATAVFVRRFMKGPIDAHFPDLRHAGFVGSYFTRRGASRAPAVLVFGGSEGGLATESLAAALAAYGYPSLAVAYFGEPGLPRTLSRIPLEYFERALAWLDRRPEVDPRSTAVLGISRGSEAALLLGLHDPAQVHAVIASVPSDAANCSYPTCGGPAWTLHGRPVPYTHEWDDPLPTDNPKALFPVERIAAPILLICGGDDQRWVSCQYSAEMMQRLRLHHDSYPHALLRAALAGHGVGSLMPDEPQVGGTSPTAVADERAREAFWPRVLAFLASLRRG
jgi:dienelactone hydrolase